MNDISYWGYHLLLDCSNCNRKMIKDPDTIEEFIETLVDRIEMEPIGKPRIEYTAEEFPDKAGYTAIQIIVTSTIVAHFVDSTGDLYLDVFSCKAFEIDTVQSIVRQYFSPQKIRTNYITRHAG